ncbi:MAG TPA: hypothetical protein VGM10_06575 [Actinocrinis sp.]|jgi:hypothetical protein
MSFGRAASDQCAGPRPHPGSARFALGAVAGCATVLPWAAYLSFRDAHPPVSAGAYYGLDIAAEVGVCALATLPASWIVLALMRLRYAFTVACAGWALSMMFSVLLGMLVPGGALPAWVYGLCSGLCYGTAALLSISPAPTVSGRLSQAAVHAAWINSRVHDADAAGPEPVAPEPEPEPSEAGS